MFLTTDMGFFAQIEVGGDESDDGGDEEDIEEEETENDKRQADIAPDSSVIGGVQSRPKSPQ